MDVDSNLQTFPPSGTQGKIGGGTGGSGPPRDGDGIFIFCITMLQFITCIGTRMCNCFICIIQIHFQNQYLVLMNPSRVVGFRLFHSLLTNHTLILTL